jgi:hypothetical protein
MPAEGICAGGSGACIYPVFGPTAPSTYWSSTTQTGSAASAWTVYFPPTAP